jgi:hypothetical protein
MSIYDISINAANQSALEALAQNREPKWQPEAVDEFWKESAPLFDANKRHKQTGESMESYIKKYEAVRPHIYLPDASTMGDAHLQYAAFGPNPTLAGRAALLKSLNGDMDSYNFVASSWNADPSKLQPGTPPGNFDSAAAGLKAQERVKQLRAALAEAEEVANATAPKAKPGDHASNPWSKAGFNVTAEGSLVRAIGAEKAARIAASVGCTIGSTKPNPNY